ncbi:FxLD family lanthipeptide [Streptomyces longispororuber]|uniref:FxLD family lanthipeptide n=1 Tax=Streptomyces longispororuber TaxID=68230 RepID=UPI00210BAE59|nr:FxLD family lanthipeptide [Streptomyces longispororuber]MCQ4210412.1 FxLD family lanthipeptide [Streptomyces longispororuber]
MQKLMVPETALSVVDEFALDVVVVQACAPVPGLLVSTDDGCGSSCDKVCASAVSNPA